MRLTKNKDSITIHNDNQTAVIREKTTMAGMDIFKKTSINIGHLMPAFEPETMVKSHTLSVGQTVHMVEPLGQGKIMEIRTDNDRTNDDHVVELIVQHNNKNKYIINYTDLIL